MDLRIVKTKKVIRDAFLELRKKHSLEKVKVKDICETALINKTTFYKYYTDVFDLSRELEDEAMEQYYAASRDTGCLFSDPEKFLAGIPKATDENMKQIYLLFSGREDLLIKRMEKHLIELYTREGMPEDEIIQVHFVISGAISTMQELSAEDKKSEALISESLAKIIGKITA